MKLEKRITKYRTGFVTNSSSTSFIAAGTSIILSLITALGFGSCENTGNKKENEGDGDYWIDTTISESSIRTDGKTYSWIYAKVGTNIPDNDTTALTDSISFSISGGYGSLLKIVDYGKRDGYKCCCVAADPPQSLPTDVKTGSAVVNAGCNAPSGYISGSESITLDLISKNTRIQIVTSPEGTSTINVGDTDPVTIFARVIEDDPDKGEVPNDELTKNITLDKAAGDAAAWVELKPTEAKYEGWVACEVKAINPYGDTDEALKAIPPKSEDVIAKLVTDKKTITEKCVLEINPRSDIELEKKSLNLLSKSEAAEKIKACIVNPGTSLWSLDYALDSVASNLCQVSIVKGEKDNTWIITIQEADKISKESGSKSRYDKGAINLSASSGNKSVNGQIDVCMMREGLYVDQIGADSDGTFILNADGQSTTDIIFYLYTWNEDTKALEANTDDLETLSLWYKTTDDILIQNASSVTELNVKYDKPYMESGAVYKANTVRPFPAKGEYVKVGLGMNTPEINGKVLSTEFVIKLKTPDTGIGSSAWEKELEEITKSINKIVPSEHRQKFFDLINQKKDYLDAQGLHIFHKEIIDLAADLNYKLMQGYLNEAAWYDKAIWWCEKAQIMGDIAISALEMVFLGPLAGVATDLVRTTIMSAYNAHVEGKSMSEWLDDEMNGITGLLTGMSLGFITDPSVIEEAIGKSPKAQALAWCIFIGYNFIDGLYKGMSVWAAAKHVGEVFAQRAAVQFLAGQMIKSRCVIDPQKALKDLSDMTSYDSEGKPTLPPGIAEKAMMDPQFVRSIKGSNNETLKQAFENSLRNDVYKPHDTALVNWIKENVPGMGSETEVRVQDFRTPKADGSSECTNVNADRDYRVMFKDPVTGEWNEIPKETWEKQSYEDFAKNSGFNETTSNKKLGISEEDWNKMSHDQRTEAWARAFRQTPTDASHIVSSRDFSDQVVNPETGKPFDKVDKDGNPYYETTNRDESGNPELTTDPHDPNIAVDGSGNPLTVKASNIELVKMGKSKLLDPQGMGEMYERKAYDEWQLNGSKSEAIKQIQKGMDELEAVRKGYQEQGINVEPGSDYEAIKQKIESVKTDLSGKQAVDGFSERDMNKALAHLAAEFKKFPAK